MLKLGQYNKLKVVKNVDFGLYLDGGDGVEILLPSRYVESAAKPGDELEVFVYNDSEERLIATTEHPFATVGQFAYLQVVDVNRVGAFLDWGLPYKNILVPFREQKDRMQNGAIYLVYIYVDETTNRIVASSKIEKFIGNKFPEYRHGEKVKILGYAHTPLGYKCIVDDLYHGMLYQNELYKPLELGVELVAYVKTVRDDGKIDLTLEPYVTTRIPVLSDEILQRLHDAGGRLDISDKSSPEEIKAMFHCSKKDFKKAIGALYKERSITLGDGFIQLVS